MRKIEMSNQRVVILGGGFAGVYTAMKLEHLLRKRQDVEVVLVNRENYLVFQPMLAEVISGNIGLLDTVSPICRLAPRTRLYEREVEDVDLANQTVTLSPGFEANATVLHYDHVVVAFGNVTDFRKIPGLHDHAFPFKYLGDALRLRDHLIRVLGEAATTTDPELRKELLTFVIGGGGFSGVEVCAELNDFVRRAGKKYFHINPNDIRTVLVHSEDRILEREMPERLGRYAQEVLRKRGVEFIFNLRLETGTPKCAVLHDGQRIPTRTLISSVPSSPNPIVAGLDVPQERGRIKADSKLQIEGFENAWSLGDCAAVPNPSGEGVCPPTAQFAIRQAATCAYNIVAAIDGQKQKNFRFKELGKMASLGHRRAIAQLFGWINLEGFLAWLFWRAAYWAKLPGIDRKIKVGVSWMLDLVCGPEIVQTKVDVKPAMSESHFEPGEIVLHKADRADRLFIILNGKAELSYEDENGEAAKSVELTAGDVFGVAEILEKTSVQANVRCIEPLTVVTYNKSELEPLLALPAVRTCFEQLR